MCTDNIIVLQNDILHSVPQHLGLVNRKPFQNVESSRASSPASQDSLDIGFTNMLSDPELAFFAEQSSAPLRKAAFFPAVGAYNLMWPLCKNPPFPPLHLRYHTITSFISLPLTNRTYESRHANKQPTQS